MNEPARKISLDEWSARYAGLVGEGLREPAYGGPLRRHAADGDVRLSDLAFDNSAAALRLWNFLLSEEDRLRAARAAGARLVGTMKDLGTVPVLVYSLPNLRAFYPDGAWWVPCLTGCGSRLPAIADSLGIGEAFCPVRAMLGAFVAGDRFPIPDLLTCSVGATCDDFSAIAQRVEQLGHPILWWEIPRRRRPDRGEPCVSLPGGGRAPRDLVHFVESELRRVAADLENLADARLSQTALAAGIRRANAVRASLARLRRLVFTARACPLPALEMLIAEALAIHFCSDLDETQRVLDDLLIEVRRRIDSGTGVLGEDAVRVFWVNPAADLRAMNLLEDCGGRVCGTEYMFTHALDPIPVRAPPMEAVARSALADPMAGPATDRARRVCRDARRFGSEAVVISRIPGASHCATESAIVADFVARNLGLPVLTIEVPSVSDALRPGLCTRLEALVETARMRRVQA